MYSRISIKNFRGIGSLEVDGLRRINLIVGRNNSGKTTFLEAVFLLGGAPNPQLPTTLGQLRGQRLGDTYPDPVWRPLFHNSDPRIPVEILGLWNEEPRERKLQSKPGWSPVRPFHYNGFPRARAELPLQFKIWSSKGWTFAPRTQVETRPPIRQSLIPIPVVSGRSANKGLTSRGRRCYPHGPLPVHLVTHSSSAPS